MNVNSFIGSKVTTQNDHNDHAKYEIKDKQIFKAGVESLMTDLTKYIGERKQIRLIFPTKEINHLLNR